MDHKLLIIIGFLNKFYPPARPLRGRGSECYKSDLTIFLAISDHFWQKYFFWQTIFGPPPIVFELILMLYFINCTDQLAPSDLSSENSGGGRGVGEKIPEQNTQQDRVFLPSSSFPDCGDGTFKRTGHRGETVPSVVRTERSRLSAGTRIRPSPS